MRALKMWSVLALGALVLTAGQAFAAPAQTPDPAAGKKFARTVCGGCHVIAEKPGHQPPPRAQGAAPHFATLAQDPAITPEKIRETLKLPHGSMANIIVSEKDVANVTSYIDSLKAR